VERKERVSRGVGGERVMVTMNGGTSQGGAGRAADGAEKCALRGTNA